MRYLNESQKFVREIDMIRKAKKENKNIMI